MTNSEQNVSASLLVAVVFFFLALAFASGGSKRDEVRVIVPSPQGQVEYVGTVDEMNDHSVRVILGNGTKVLINGPFTVITKPQVEGNK